MMKSFIYILIEYQNCGIYNKLNNLSDKKLSFIILNSTRIHLVKL